MLGVISADVMCWFAWCRESKGMHVLAVDGREKNCVIRVRVKVNTRPSMSTETLGLWLGLGLDLALGLGFELGFGLLLEQVLEFGLRVGVGFGSRLGLNVDYSSEGCCCGVHMETWYLSILEGSG
eukprot:1347209-Amorphochlora_amoeboformis.AAC.1